MMEITEKPIGEIKPYPGNPRINDRAVSYVAESIKEFGMKVPLVLDREGVIIAGHTRLEALKSLGAETAPCVIADDLTPDEARAYRLADNRVAEFSTWDKAALQEELATITGLDMARFGFTPEELRIDTTQEEPLKVCPWSVLDARTIEWQARRQAWRQALGNAADPAEDPVLLEVLLRWFTQPRCRTVADPYGARNKARAGVARALGFQIAAEGPAGALITEPTYTHMEEPGYADELARAFHALKPGSFAAVVVADLRDRNGAWKDNAEATAAALEAAGGTEHARLAYIEPWAGKRPAGMPDKGRVLRVHKEVAVFFKGDARKINLPRVELTLPAVPEVRDAD